MPSRRTFLTSAAAGLTGGLFAACQTTRSEIDALPEGLPRRSDYSLDPAISYLNHGSIGTIPRIVQRARQRYLETCEQNPAHYMWDEPWQALREEVRARLAGFVHCDARELAITHNTTEGFNLLAQGLPLGTGDEVLFSSLNHPGASLCWQHVARQRGFGVRQFELPIGDVRTLDAESYVARHIAEVTDATRVVVLPHIDNVIGYHAPIRRLADALRERGVDYVAVDGAQAVGMVPVDIDALGVDFYAGSPHKWLQSPKGLGLLYVRRSRLDQLEPMWVTWGQQRWAGSARVFEDYGTRNLPEVLALGDAVAFHQKTSWQQRTDHYSDLRRFAQELCADHPSATFSSPSRWQPGSSLFGVHVRGSAEDLGARLLDAGVVVRLFPRPDGVVVRISPNVLNARRDLATFFAALPA